MAYKLLALDLDGTVLGSDRLIHPATVEAVAKVQSMGIEVMIVTGRHHTATLPYYRQLGLHTPAICCNGTYLYSFDQQAILAADPLDNDSAEALLAHIRQLRTLRCVIYTADAMVYEDLDEDTRQLLKWAGTHPPALQPCIRRAKNFESLLEGRPTLWKFLISHTDRLLLAQYVKEMASRFDLSYEWSWTCHVDIARKGNTKGNRLLAWARNRGIEASEIMAIGDNHNDISMLSEVGLGIAMGNADTIVKAAAHDITETNDNIGVASALHRHLLDKA